MIGALRRRGGGRAPSAPPTPAEVAAGQEGLPHLPTLPNPARLGPACVCWAVVPARSLFKGPWPCRALGPTPSSATAGHRFWF